MTSKLKYTAALLVLAGLQSIFAQKKDENIGTEVVNVVKPYTPTISDAFKVKETPALDDEETLKKENITYTIFSFPVASTFAPAKGRAASVDREEKERLFANYLTLGIGNYANANAELFVNQNIDENSYAGGMLRHFSSQGGVKDAILDDNFAETSLDLGYGYRTDALTWTADIGFKNRVYNWYGVDPELRNMVPQLYDGIDPKHTYNDLSAGTKVTMNSSFFKEAAVKFDRFWDDFDSAENRLLLKPSFEFDMGEGKLKADFVVDYLGGSFSREAAELKYGYTNFGVHPSYVINRNDWTIDLGFSAFYSADMEHNDSKFFVYPSINASLKVVGDLMIFYTGAKGGLQQNSYRDFTASNPYVSPYLLVAPTDEQYDLFAGLKGKLASGVAYNIRGSYKNENDKALFAHNSLQDINVVDTQRPYAYGNSFGLVYDKVSTLSFFGELKADFSKSVSFGVNGTFATYGTDVYREAWNLPQVQLAMTLDVDVSEKWSTGFKLFYVGERKDAVFTDVAAPIGSVTLDPYFDANAYLNYRHNERWSAFLKLNNIANQTYEKWYQYPVQSFQAMVGANYKFDF